jgi:hypothetical protein
VRRVPQTAAVVEQRRLYRDGGARSEIAMRFAAHSDDDRYESRGADRGEKAVAEPA